MPAERLTFQDPIQPIVYWDTSFAVAFMFDSEPYHTECCQLQERLEHERILSVVSDFVLDEVAFLTMKRILVKEARRTGAPWTQARRQDPTLGLVAAREAMQRRSDLEERALKVLIPDSVTDRAFQLMHDFALLPTDAYHIATALENEVTAVATLDQDFLSVDGIIVYTCLP